MKNQLRLFLCFIATGLLLNSNAQNGILPNRGCGSGILPQQFENWVQGLTPSGHQIGGQNQTQSVFNIPVIVHVIHSNATINSTNATSGDNLNAAQIADQINILNKDYNGLNTDTALVPTVFKPVAGHFQFNFCLAVVNPTGGVLAEPGIDRVDANTNNWATSAPYSTTFVDGTIKPNTIWDPTHYLNMWVCDLGGGLLGYATFPNPGLSGLGGLSAPYGSSTTDGLVMLNTAFGSVGTAVSGSPYNLGRTATHELGHWVGLRHVWGDNGQCGGSDFCNDTPPQFGGTSQPAGANYGCPTFPLNANTCTLSGVSNTHGDMFMNYMDYVNDACMYMFTNDQKNRAQLIMTNSPMRSSLLTSTVCSLPTALNDIAILFVANPTYSQVINCNNFINPIVNIENFGSDTISSATFSYNVDGVNTQTLAWTGILSPAASLTVSLPTINNLGNGVHVYNVGVFQPNGTTDPNLTNNTNSQNFSITNSYTVFAFATNSAAICPGQIDTLQIMAPAGASYTWVPGWIPTVVDGSMHIVSPSVTTVYTVYVFANGCGNSTTVQVTVGGAAPTVVPSSSLLCGAGTVTLVASGANSYTWTGGLSTATVVVNPTVTTTYTVAGDSGSGCSGVAAVTITVAPIPTLTLTANPTVSICIGGSATLTAAGATTYSFSSGETTHTAIVSPTVTTFYTVTGTSLGCSSTETVMVPVGPGSISLLLSANPATVCAGESATLTGSGATSYSWSNGASTPSIVVHPTVTTVYSFDGSNGTCNGHASATVNVFSSPPLGIHIAPASGKICSGNSATLTASGTYSNYVWAPGISGQSVVVTPTTSIHYTVMGTNPSGCAADSIIMIHVGSDPVSVLNSTNSACASPCNGAISATTTGGTAPYTYSISGSNCSSMPCTNLCPGLYTIHTTDSIGCHSSAIFSIANFANAFVASVSFSNASCGSCHDGMLHANLFSGVAPFHYSWFPSGGNHATADSLTTGCYTVTVTDSVGCLVSALGCVYLVDGIKTLSGNSALVSVYPNPAKSSVTIDYQGTTFDYTIYNHLGQMLVSQKGNKNTALINLENFAFGIYLVEADNGKEKIRKKLIIE